MPSAPPITQYGSAIQLQQPLGQSHPNLASLRVDDATDFLGKRDQQFAAVRLNSKQVVSTRFYKLTYAADLTAAVILHYPATDQLKDVMMIYWERQRLALWNSHL